MKFSCIIPHYRTGEMTAYTIAQLLKCKGNHELDIYVVNNNSGDGTEKYLEPFMNDIKYYEYPKGLMQSHGIAYDYILPRIETEYFITLESDSFPTQSDWLDYYEELILDGYDSAGSLLKLSGGEFMHPAGAMYRKSIWEEAKRYANSIKYSYFPNISVKDTHDCHLMVHNDILKDFMNNPTKYISLAKNYKFSGIQDIINKLVDYMPTTCVFHNGMGNTDESLYTYGQRCAETEVPNIILNNNAKIINRIGYEPAQFFYYWQLAIGKRVFHIPTEIKWLPNRENQQQEYTLMSNGLNHLWAVSAYKDSDNPAIRDIEVVKKSIPKILYDTLPEHQKIK